MFRNKEPPLYGRLCSPVKHFMPSRIHSGWAMWLSFQKSHSNLCRKSRTPPFPQTSGPEQTLKTKATTKSPSWGCPRLKFPASLTFRKRSPYAPFEKRPPCPCFYCIMETQGPSIKAKVWDSSKGRIFRIKTTLTNAAARVAVCMATA